MSICNLDAPETLGIGNKWPNLPYLHPSNVNGVPDERTATVRPGSMPRCMAGPSM